MSNFPRTLVKGLMAISGRFWPKAATQHLQLQDRMIGGGCEAAGIVVACTKPY